MAAVALNTERVPETVLDRLVAMQLQIERLTQMVQDRDDLIAVLRRAWSDGQ